jgi:hypothetical protein
MWDKPGFRQFFPWQKAVMRVKIPLKTASNQGLASDLKKYGN